MHVRTFDSRLLQLRKFGVISKVPAVTHFRPVCFFVEADGWFFGVSVLEDTPPGGHIHEVYLLFVQIRFVHVPCR